MKHGLNSCCGCQKKTLVPAIHHHYLGAKDQWFWQPTSVLRGLALKLDNILALVIRGHVKLHNFD